MAACCWPFPNQVILAMKIKAVLFDVTVRPLPDGRYEAAWELRVHDEPARLELSDLELLRRLAPDGPQRLLFGARISFSVGVLATTIGAGIGVSAGSAPLVCM